MEWAKRKMRVTGQAGRMLQNSLIALQRDGEVSGCVVSDLDRLESEGGICGWCASEPTQLVGLELWLKSEPAARIRTVAATICLPLCTDCFTSLTQSLKLTVG